MTRFMQLQHITEQLHIGDALELKKCFPGDPQIEHCYKSRTNPIKYLSKTFKYPVTLLAAMFDSGCILSGSRALDFFIPGSATANSDWDFYVPGYKESLADMIQALSKSGVIWDSEGNAIAETLSEQGTAIVNRSVLECLNSWRKQISSDVIFEVMGEGIIEVLSAFDTLDEEVLPEAYTIVRQPNGEISLYPNHYQQCEDKHVADYHDPTGQPFSMMRGFIENGSGRTSVQLIVGSYYSGTRSCLNFVKDFYASHVQCFISGWCAAHMYYHHACGKNPIRWESSYEKNTALVEKAIMKYRERGFHFHRAEPVEPTIRRLDDNQSFFVDFSDLYRPYLRRSSLNIFDQWTIQRRKNIETIHWVEFDRNIFDLYSPMNACLRTKGSFSTESFSLPLAHLRRLADMIALNCSGPNEMRDHSFRSCVRKSVARATWHVNEAAQSGTVYCALQEATPWSWVL